MSFWKRRPNPKRVLAGVQTTAHAVLWFSYYGDSEHVEREESDLRMCYDSRRPQMVEFYYHTRYSRSGLFLVSRSFLEVALNAHSNTSIKDGSTYVRTDNKNVEITYVISPESPKPSVSLTFPLKKLRDMLDTAHSMFPNLEEVTSTALDIELTRILTGKTL